jgi:isoquinoline 1-oxidoreductase alpha subunit
VPVISLRVNGAERSIDAEPETPLLWALREQLGLHGTKFGCGMALCGACTVHLDGRAVRSCMVRLSEASGRSVDTIEGVGEPTLRVIQQAWVAENVPQCGYCQTGQVMSALALLRARPAPTADDVDAAMAANICRCGTYQRIRRAILRAAAELRKTGGRVTGGR